jgi:N-acetylglucosaminyl-diphospho-decaprenol L-rhamnosyltransferase
MAPTVHVVVVNWNTGGYLRECLESVVLAAREGVAPAKVTIVDNASRDRSAEGLDGLPLPLEVVRNPTNVGFAAACNQGAAGTTADYLLFLNPDTRLFPDTLETVTRFMESERAAGVGICGVQIVDREGRPVISCARFPTPRVLIGKMTGLDAVLPRFFPGHHLTVAETAASGYVDQVIGAFTFVRAELFRRLGGFDDRYFMYFEDVDFALRARRHGARSYFLGDARAFHAENVSSDQIRGRRLYYSLRSRITFTYRHWPRWQAIAVALLTLTVEFAARIVSAVLHASWRDLAATVAGYGRLAGDLPRAAAAFGRRARPKAGSPGDASEGALR